MNIKIVESQSNKTEASETSQWVDQFVSFYHKHFRIENDVINPITTFYQLICTQYKHIYHPEVFIFSNFIGISIFTKKFTCVFNQTDEIVLNSVAMNGGELFILSAPNGGTHIFTIGVMILFKREQYRELFDQALYDLLPASEYKSRPLKIVKSKISLIALFLTELKQHGFNPKNIGTDSDWDLQKQKAIKQVFPDADIRCQLSAIENSVVWLMGSKNQKLRNTARDIVRKHTIMEHPEMCTSEMRNFCLANDLFRPWVVLANTWYNPSVSRKWIGQLHKLNYNSWPNLNNNLSVLVEQIKHSLNTPSAFLFLFAEFWHKDEIMHFQKITTPNCATEYLHNKQFAEFASVAYTNQTFAERAAVNANPIEFTCQCADYIMSGLRVCQHILSFFSVETFQNPDFYLHLHSFKSAPFWRHPALCLDCDLFSEEDIVYSEDELVKAFLMPFNRRVDYRPYKLELELNSEDDRLALAGKKRRFEDLQLDDDDDHADHAHHATDHADDLANEGEDLWLKSDIKNIKFQHPFCCDKPMCFKLHTSLPNQTAHMMFLENYRISLEVAKGIIEEIESTSRNSNIVREITDKLNLVALSALKDDCVGHVLSKLMQCQQVYTVKYSISRKVVEVIPVNKLNEILKLALER